jgi:acid phosphatase
MLNPVQRWGFGRKRLAGTAVAIAIGLAATACTGGSPQAKPSAAPSSAAASTPGATPSSTPNATPARTGLPAPDHVVVVVLENHGYADVIGNTAAPYLNSLAGQGANLTRASAVTHPSEPNYLALFAGSTLGVTDDSCPHSFSGPNLGAALLQAGLTFAGYSEGMPYDGYKGCSVGAYARKHNPWVNFTNVPASSNLTFARFPADYTSLPSLSFVVPNLNDDMHDGSVAAADTWVHDHLGRYAQWAATHNSLLVVTFDEASDSYPSNRIATVFYGQSVRPGRYAESVDSYRLLATLLALYRLPPIGTAADRTPVTDIWAQG